MTVTAVRKDPQTLTMTLGAEFDASPERMWQLWADPRQFRMVLYEADLLRQARAKATVRDYRRAGHE
jgi:uncharacterized protein YndB with AHSA1/START domain